MPLTMAVPQGFPTSVGGPTAVYRERMPINKRALLAVGEKRDGTRNVVRHCETPHRYAPGNVRIAVGAARLVGRIHLGFDPARANCIYADTSTTPLRGQGPRQSDQSML